jgi:hypothetical protein
LQLKNFIFQIFFLKFFKIKTFLKIFFNSGFSFFFFLQFNFIFLKLITSFRGLYLTFFGIQFISAFIFSLKLGFTKKESFYFNFINFFRYEQLGLFEESDIPFFFEQENFIHMENSFVEFHVQNNNFDDIFLSYSHTVPLSQHSLYDIYTFGIVSFCSFHLSFNFLKFFHFFFMNFVTF